MKTLALFVLTAVAEIVGCYLPYLWLRQDKSVWLLVPAALSLALFAWLLSLHPTAAGVDVIVERILPKVEELVGRVQK